LISEGSILPSGPNQHYLPRFLQKPFGTRPKRKEIWVFARDVPADKVRCKNVGASDHFYSYPSADDARTLDDDITEIETGISEKLNLIRAKTIGSTINASDAAEIINHLVPRTAHVRLNLERGLRMMADGIASVLNDEERIQSLIGLDQDEPNEDFKNKLANKLLELGYMEKLGIPIAVIERVAFFQAKENFASLAAETIPALCDVLNSWLQTSDEVVREIHNNTLQAVSNSTPRLSVLQELNWRIESAQSEGAILPDCVALALEGIDDPAPAMFADWKNVVAIIMPVAPDKLLVGAITGFDIKEFPDFNNAAARCSHNFFLAPKNDDYLIGLQSLLGQRSTKLVEDGITAALAPYLAPEAKARDKAEPLFPIDLFEKRNEPWKYELSLIDFGDIAETQAVSSTVNGIVSVLAEVVPLQRLDGITISSDYRKALATLDRGYETASAIESAPEEIGKGIAKTISVNRDGRWKEQIVFDADVGLALLAEDESRVNWASYIIIRQLIEVAIPEIIESSLPGVWMSPIDDAFHNFLYPRIHPAIFSYVTSHICAGFGDTVREARSHTH
jgi:Protein of unknown function (DUF4238)